VTRRRIVFTDQSGRRFVTPEFNGDKIEFGQFGMGDTCTATWDEILGLFRACSTLNEFKAANDLAQEYYHSSAAPGAPPEPLVEFNVEVPLPEEIRCCDKLIYLQQTAINDFIPRL